MYRVFIIIFIVIVEYSFGEINVIKELDSSWDEIKKSIKDGDFRKFKKMYHRDAILVNGIKNSTYPIRSAFNGWEKGFRDTKADSIDANLELKFSQRIFDNSTAHEKGIFHYYTINKKGRTTDSFIYFEALWIKKQNKWFMLMEKQISRTNKSEWDSFNSIQ